jgi:aspartate kinase
MIVYKFGGASVSTARAIENLAKIVSQCKDDLVIIISAFGKSTNLMETILELWLENSEDRFLQLETLKKYHTDIIKGLFTEVKHRVYNEFNELSEYLEARLRKHPDGDYDFEYDQIVSYGELFSTKIVSTYLNSLNINNQWIDAREWLITDSNFREANVDFNKSAFNIKEHISRSASRVFITQGFIGGTPEGYTTTLGREGSDYTAAIAANLLDAEKLIVWKDVPGILTADPLYFPEAEKLEEISYQEAIELSFFGAKVIHPKTIKPLQNKNIPLFVKSFIDPEASGTLIRKTDFVGGLKPILIIKKQQVLVSLTPRDYSFVVEDCLSRIFAFFFTNKMKVNLLQHSAISFTICIDNRKTFADRLMKDMSPDFRILYNEGLELITIRHYTQDAINRHTAGREILVEQRSRNTVMYVVR